MRYVRAMFGINAFIFSERHFHFKTTREINLLREMLSGRVRRSFSIRSMKLLIFFEFNDRYEVK